MRHLVEVSGTTDERIAALARFQRGRVSRVQLIEAGVSEWTIDHLLRVGRLQRQHRGVYAVGHSAPIELGRETAAVLAIQADVLLSHASAAAIWGLATTAPDHAVEVTVVGQHAKHRPGIIVHRTRHLHPFERRQRHGLPITSPARALLDIAPRLTVRQLERSLDEALVRRLTTRAQIQATLSWAQGRAGAAILSELVADRGPGSVTRSPPEELLLAIIRKARLPQPEVNAGLHGFEVDFYWPSERLVVEVDSYTYHTSRTAFERDKRKDAVLRAAGIEVMRVTPRMIEHEPYPLLVEVAQALAIRRRWAAQDAALIHPTGHQSRP